MVDAIMAALGSELTFAALGTNDRNAGNADMTSKYFQLLTQVHVKIHKRVQP